MSLKSNKENMIFIYELIKILKIKNKNIFKVLKSFKGLNHRHEIFLKKKISLLLTTQRLPVLKLAGLHFLAIKIYSGLLEDYQN